MTTTRYFEVKVRVRCCLNCTIADHNNFQCSKVTRKDWSEAGVFRIYDQNKDKLTTSCYMVAQHKKENSK